MASSPIHLAIAKMYLERNKEILNKNQVLSGTLYPDTIKDKNMSHYADLDKRGKDNRSHLQGKVNLFSFLKEHESLNDFEMGWFIHLVTDYLFFDECFSDEYLFSHSYEEFRKDLYFSYDCLTNYLMERYNITIEDYTVYTSEYYPGKTYQKCLLSKEMIDSFILRVGSIDFREYEDKIRLVKRNVKPL